MRRRSRRRATTCSPSPDTTSSVDGLAGAARRSGSWPGRTGTARSIGRCGCSASAPTRSAPSRSTTGAGWTPGRSREELARERGPTIVCAQLGDVNTGACDDLVAAADAAADAGAWLHVDGAFGLWAAASPALRHLTAGSERADSWATDAHKWLNVPYDSGIVFCAHPEAHRAALGIRSVYLVHADPDTARDPVDWNPEHSRRARGFAVYAALRSLGRSGVAELVERCCAHARAIAAGLAELPGCELLNDVVLNQVLVRFETDEETERVAAAMQAGGEAWMGTTLWDDRRAIRISVSSRLTSGDDVRRTIDAFAAIRRERPVASRA